MDQLLLMTDWNPSKVMPSMTILQQFVWFVWLCSNVQTVKWVKYMQTAGYNGTHMVYKFHQQEHCVGCFKDPEIDDLQGEIPGKTFLVMIWSQLSHNSPTSRICVKYFLSFSQKNLSPEKTQTN